MQKFVNDCSGNNITLTQRILSETAKEFASELNIENFKKGNGFVAKFIKRNNIVKEVIHGESSSVSEQTVIEWKKKLPQITSGYAPRDIFNIDEFGLFYRLTPNYTYKVRGKKFKGGKKSKERVTILIGANSDGSEKLKLLLALQRDHDVLQRIKCFQFHIMQTQGRG